VTRFTFFHFFSKIQNMITGSARRNRIDCSMADPGTTPGLVSIPKLDLSHAMTQAMPNLPGFRGPVGVVNPQPWAGASRKTQFGITTQFEVDRNYGEVFVRPGQGAPERTQIVSAEASHTGQLPLCPRPPEGTPRRRDGSENIPESARRRKIFTDDILRFDCYFVESVNESALETQVCVLLFCISSSPQPNELIPNTHTSITT
jgi:hypothetical protein